MVITVPALQALWSEHDEANHHFRRYSRRLLGGRLTEHGFKIVCLGYHFGWTIVPMLGRRLLASSRRERSARAKYKVSVPASPLNAFLHALSLADHAVARRLWLPVGSSLHALCRRPAD